jgi:hypothetical protein
MFRKAKMLSIVPIIEDTSSNTSSEIDTANPDKTEIDETISLSENK